MKNFIISMLLFSAVEGKSQVGIGTNLPKSTLDVNGSISQKVTTVTADLSLDITNAVVLCNNASAITITLPTANLAGGRIYYIKRINTGSVAIAPANNQTIDGTNSLTLSTIYDVSELISDGNNWYNLYKKATGTSGHFIGENFGGGIIFYLDASGNHGLIAASSDQSSGVKWNNPGTSAGSYFYAQLQGLYSGQANTYFLTSFNAPNFYAAAICADLVVDTYNDWYLPSAEELNTMYRNLYKQGLGNFLGSSTYWSSTAYQNTNEAAYATFFGTGEQTVADISDPNHVRAVRSF